MNNKEKKYEKWLNENIDVLLQGYIDKSNTDKVFDRFCRKTYKLINKENKNSILKNIIISGLQSIKHITYFLDGAMGLINMLIKFLISCITLIVMWEHDISTNWLIHTFFGLFIFYPFVKRQFDIIYWLVMKKFGEE